MHNFYRRIKPKTHFKNPQIKVRFTEEGISRKPTNETWVPDNNHQSIETFIEAPRNEINKETEKKKQPIYSNLSAKEQKPLQEQQPRGSIVITDTDNVGSVVIIDVENYIKEAERQVLNAENYKSLNHNPTETSYETANKIIKKFHKEYLISKTITEGLKIEIPKSQHFNLKPETHIEGLPGRLVCKYSKLPQI